MARCTLSAKIDETKSLNGRLGSDSSGLPTFGPIGSSDSTYRNRMGLVVPCFNDGDDDKWLVIFILAASAEPFTSVVVVTAPAIGIKLSMRYSENERSRCIGPI